MTLLDPTYIRDNVDYSFGDQSGIHLFNGYIKLANASNKEFISKYNEIKKIKKVMTLFIDNIRLYQRIFVKYTAIEELHESARIFKDNKLKEFSDNDLLKLCSELEDMNFIIFTGFEDTPIDDEIFDKIPKNVLAIYASNAQSFGEKVHPIPYGIQRKLNQSDNRQEILKSLINIDISPSKLLYINHSIGNNPIRKEINNKYNGLHWAKVDNPKTINYQDYNNYLHNILNHKFMICPDGNAIGCECHRDWEVLYLRRVPIVIKTKYLEKIFENIPVLFVDSFLEITENFLIEKNYLFEEMQNFDLSKLDMKVIYENSINNHIL
jgi:hypothetical protein